MKFLWISIGPGTAVAEVGAKPPATTTPGSTGAGVTPLTAGTATKVETAVAGQREAGTAAKPLFENIMVAFPRHRMQELARRLQDLRAKDKAYPGAVSTVPFRSHGCTVTISYDFSGGFCHVRFEQEGLPSEDDNLKFVLSKDGGSYTLYLNRAGNPNTLTLESTLGSLNVNHAACPPQYRDFMMSVARVVAELFPVDTAETASTYTGGSASAAVERSIAIASQRPSTSRDVSVAAAAASTLKHSMRDIALAGLSAINESKFGQDRLNGMSDVQKYALKNCGQILTALLKAESAGAALAALFDGRTVASNGETVVRFVKDGTGGKLKFIAFSTEEIDQAFRDLATGSSATTEGILSEIAGFYGLAS